MATLPQTQEELNDLIEGRLKRAREKWEREEGVAQMRERAERAESAMVAYAAKGMLRAEGMAPDKIDRTARLLDLDGVELGDDGSVPEKEIKARIKDARKSYPEMFADLQHDVPGPHNSDNGGKTSADKPLTFEQIKRMSPEEIMERSAEVDAVLERVPPPPRLAAQ